MSQERYWAEPNLSETDVKRQHFVPKMYLRSFVNEAGKIGVCDLNCKTKFETTLDNVAVRTHFNDMNFGGAILSTESWLADLEGRAAPVLRKLVDAPRLVGHISVEEEMGLARFVAALMFRTPAFRDWTDRTTAPAIEDIKSKAKIALLNRYTREVAESLWEQWKDKPDWWWLGEAEPPQDAGFANFMLGEVQGWANLLVSMPWRVGNIPMSHRMYTSDNPVAKYEPIVKPWWDMGFTSHDYFLALSPGVLLKICRSRPGESGDVSKPQGERIYRDFNVWDASVARHIVTANAHRYLYGEGPYVSKDCAYKCLAEIDQSKLRIAQQYSGFDPSPPRAPAELRSI